MRQEQYMPNDKAQTYLTTQEVAALLRTSADSVRYWRHVGRGPKSFKVGRRVLYDQADLNAWLLRLKTDVQA
jgi:excisionase family DNA binding protein